VPNKRSDEVAQAWGEWVAATGEWHVFGGLTYDPARAFGRPHPEACGKHVRRWLRAAPRALGREVEAAVVATEYHRSGWPHFHPLLRLAGGNQGNELRELGQLWFREHGYAKLEVPRSVQDVAMYAAKYLSKDLSTGDVLLWPPKGDLRAHAPALLALLPPARRR